MEPGDLHFGKEEKRQKCYGTLTGNKLNSGLHRDLTVHFLVGVEGEKLLNE